MAGAAPENSVDLKKLRVEAETLISQFHELAEALSRYQPPKDGPLKVGQLREISKTITNLENRNLPVPDELRSLKTDLFLQTHQFEEVDAILTMVEQESGKILAKFREQNLGQVSVASDRKPRRNSGDSTPHSVLRECIIKSLRKHNGRARSTTVLDDIGEMLKGKFTAADLEFGDYNKSQPIWRRNACLQRRVMVRAGLIEDDTDGGFWQLTTHFAATVIK